MPVLNRSIILMLALLLPVYVHATAGLTYHGKITKSNGSALEAPSVDFHIQLRSPNAENCLLFDETQTLDMTGSAGIFVLTIGEGTRVGAGVDGGHSLDKIFSNRGVLTGLTCTIGNSYTKSMADPRKLIVQFNDGSGWQTLPTSLINYMPLAIESMQVGGYQKEQLLRVADGVTATEMTGANWSALWALITGTSTVYQKADGSNFAPTADVDFNGQQIVDVADPTAAQDAATKNYVDTTVGGKTLDPAGVSNLAGNGRTIVWDQAQNRWVTGIPNDTTKLALSGGTMSGAINMGAFSVTNVGHVVIADQGTMYLGKFTNAQETTFLGSGLNNTTDRGRTWYNIDTGKIRYWNGSSAQTVGGISGADVTTALGYTPVNKAGDTMSGALAMGTNKITGVGDPTVAQDAATKNYVDGRLLGLTLAAPGAGQVGQAVRWNAANTAWEYYTPTPALGFTPVNKAGDTMTGLLILSGDPSNAVGAATKQYVDAVSTASAGAYVRIDGTSSLSADWDLNGATVGGTRKILGLDTPTVADGAANKSYVDAREAAAVTAANTYADTVGADALSDAEDYADTVSAAAQAAAQTYADGKLATKNIAVPAAGQDGQSIRWNQTAGNWEYFTAGAGAGTVSTVTSANSDIAITNNTTTPELTLNVGTGNNQIVKLNGSAQLPAVSGINLTNLNADNIASGTLADARLSTNVALKSYVDAGDAKLVTKDLAVPAAGQNGQSIRWNDTSGDWEYFTPSTGSGDLKSDGSVAMSADWDLNGATAGGTRKLLGLDAPTVADGAANKAYVDARETAAVTAAGTYADTVSAAAQAAAQTYADGKLVTKDLAVPALAQDGQSIRWNNTSGDWEYFSVNSGDGSAFTNLDADNISSGTLADARLSSNVALKSYVDAGDAKLVTKDLAVPALGQDGQSIRWNNTSGDWEYFTVNSGDGSAFTNLDADNISSGTLADARLSTNVALKSYVDAGDAAERTYVDGKLVSKDLAVPALAQDGQSIRWNNTSGDWEYFAINSGDGSALTNLDADNIASGTLADARLSANVALKSYVDAGDAKLVTKDLAVPAAGQDGQSIRWNNTSGDWEYFTAGSGSGTVSTVTSANSDASITNNTTTPEITINTGTGNNQIVKLNGSAQLPAVSGINLTNLNADNIASGTVADARLSSNVALKSYVDAGDAKLVTKDLAVPTATEDQKSIKWDETAGDWVYFTPATGSGDLKSDGSVAMSADWDLNGATAGGTRKLLGLDTPTVADGAANKAYVDARETAAVTAAGTYADTVSAAAQAAAQTYADGKLVTKDLAVPAAGQDGQSIRWNNTSGDWEYFTAGSGSGTVTTVTSANGDATIANNTTTPEITINTGTGNNQIVKLNGSAQLPAVSGINLTNLNADNIASGTVADARLSSNVALKSYADANILGLPLAAPAAGQAGQSIRWNAGNTAWEYYTPSTSIAADSLDFTDFNDSLALDASTSITAPSGQAYALSIVNEGTGNSFQVSDEAGDSTPFFIDNVGNVGMGASLAVNGTASAVFFQSNHATRPSFTWNASGNGLNQKHWTADAWGSTFSIQAVDDSKSGGTTFIAADRDAGFGISRVYFPNGNVGIGTASTNALLTVEGVTSLREVAAPSATADYGKIYVKSADSKLYFMDDSGVESALGGAASLGADTVDFTELKDSMALDASTTITAPSGQAYSLLISNEGTGDSFRVNDASGDTTPFVVDADGEVGIGKASPGNKLQIDGTDEDARIVLRNKNSTADRYPGVVLENYTGAATNGYPVLQFRNAGGTNSSSTDSPINSTLGAISWRGYSSGHETVAQLNAATGPNFSGTDYEGMFIFKTRDGADPDPTERMRIAADGKVTIGAGVASELLTVEGVAALRETAAPSNTANYGKIYVKTSDSKLYYMDDSGVESQLGVAGISGLTTGRVPFASSATALADSANLFWDSTNSRLGIGTNSPSGSLDVEGGAVFLAAPAAPPVNGDFANSQVAFYQDEANDALRVKYKESNGTVQDKAIAGVGFEGARMERKLTVQSIPHATTTKVAFDSAAWNVGGMADIPGGRVNIITSGKYLVSASWLASNMDPNEDVWIAIYKNGTMLFNHVNTNGPGTNIQVPVLSSEVVDLVSGDYLEMYITQYEGAAQNTSTLVNGVPRMEVVKLDPGIGGVANNDNMGNHQATANLQMGSYWLSSDGDNEGLRVSATGAVTTSGTIAASGAISSTGSIDATGNLSTMASLGVGDTTPAAKLQIANNVATNYLDTFAEYQILLYEGASAPASYGIGIKGSTMVFNSGAGAYSFDSAGTGSRMVIDTTGKVGIGTTAALTEQLEVNGTVKAVSYVTTSDARLKENITPAGGLDVISMLNGVNWTWKEKGGHDSGVLAQDVEKVMPHAVVTDAATGMKAVRYNALIAPLIESTKQLHGMCLANEEANVHQDRKIASLESENEKLKKEVEDLKSRMNKIEEMILRGKD